MKLSLEHHKAVPSPSQVNCFTSQHRRPRPKLLRSQLQVGEQRDGRRDTDGIQKEGRAEEWVVAEGRKMGIRMRKEWMGVHMSG